MAQVRGGSAIWLVFLLVATSIFAVMGEGPNTGRGVQHDQLRPEYDIYSLPGTTGLNALPEENVAAEEDRRTSSTAGRRLQQSVLGCNGEVGICGTQAANSGFTSADFVGSGGGYGAGNGIGNADAGRRGGGDGRGGRRGGRAGRKMLQTFATGTDILYDDNFGSGVRGRFGRGGGGRGRGGRRG